MQLWYALSDPVMEEALYEIVPMRQFAGLSLLGAVPDETTILALRHRLEQHELAKRLFESVAAHLAGRNLYVKQARSWARRSSMPRARPRMPASAGTRRCIGPAKGCGGTSGFSCTRPAILTRGWYTAGRRRRRMPQTRRWVRSVCAGTSRWFSAMPGTSGWVSGWRRVMSRRSAWVRSGAR